MPLLDVIQAVCQRTNVPIPSSVLGTTDPLWTQMLHLLEEEGHDLSERGEWQALTNEATFVTLAAESQGAMTSIATNGFRSVKLDPHNNTIWDRTNRLPVLGPLSADEWQTRKALLSSGPRYVWRIRGGLLIINPAPLAGAILAFEYLSKNWILGADGTTYKQYFTLDTDTILLPEELVIMGLRWRWKKEKGLEYAEDFNTYQEQVKDALGRDGGKRTLSMDNEGRDRSARPGIFVPQYNFPL